MGKNPNAIFWANHDVLKHKQSSLIVRHHFGIIKFSSMGVTVIQQYQEITPSTRCQCFHLSHFLLFLFYLVVYFTTAHLVLWMSRYCTQRYPRVQESNNDNILFVYLYIYSTQYTEILIGVRKYPATC